MIFTIQNLSMQVLIWNCLRYLFIIKIALQQLQGGLCNEFDCFSCKIKFFESAF